MAYGLDDESDQTVLVYDLGGGTFDVSVLDLGGGVYEVVATNGDNDLGGDDWDEALIDHLAKEFKNNHGIDLREDRQALQRLKDAAEEAKIELSSKRETTVNLPFITATDSGPVHLEQSITRATFENLTSDLIERTVNPTEQALSDADYSSRTSTRSSSSAAPPGCRRFRSRSKRSSDRSRRRTSTPTRVALGARGSGRRALRRRRRHRPAGRDPARARD